MCGDVSVGKPQQMKKVILLLSLLAPVLSSFAQALTEKKGVRIWEHHSSSINNNMPFGNGANGSEAGYDFISHKHYPSFNPATQSKWTASFRVSLDLAEHNGKYGGNKPFGFTSGVSSIWMGDIEGNGMTLYMEAPSSFNYTSATKATDIKNAFDATKATKAIETVTNGKIYLAQVRGSSIYVAMKITKVQNLPLNHAPNTNADVYFEFDYKYGNAGATSIETTTIGEESFTIVPNPAKGMFKIELPSSLDAAKTVVSISNMTGQIVYSEKYASGEITHNLPAGNYIVRLNADDKVYQSRLTIVE